jgi:hypothetical protein
MRAFKMVLFLLALIPILTGPLDWALGLQAPHLIGARLSVADARDPLLDSQIRFFGAIWFGVGLLLATCATDPRGRSLFLEGLFAVLFLAGIGRTLSIVQFGLPASPEGAAFVVVTTAVEIIGMPLLWLWLASLARDGLV